MNPKKTIITREEAQRNSYLYRIKRFATFQAQIKFQEVKPKHTTPVEPEYRALPRGVTIDDKLAAYEEGFFSIAIKYLPHAEAVGVTNIQVNADYARYLDFLRGNPTRPPPAVEEPIYPAIPLPAVLQHPTPREPDYIRIVQRNRVHGSGH